MMIDNMEELIARSDRMREANESIPKDVSEKVDQIIKEEFPDADRIFGICHSIWRRKKELYKEQKKSTTIVKPPKIGRNDPCPCGSGKKYTKCCGR